MEIILTFLSFLYENEFIKEFLYWGIRIFCIFLIPVIFLAYFFPVINIFDAVETLWISIGIGKNLIYMPIGIIAWILNIFIFTFIYKKIKKYYYKNTQKPL